jgi:hypothetical protein
VTEPIAAETSDDNKSTSKTIVPPPSVRLAVIGTFSAVIAFATIFAIPTPGLPALYEITWAPAIYFMLAIVCDRWTAASATCIGSFIGEAYNVAFKGGGSPIYPFGMLWARGPEVLIIAWAAPRGPRAWVIGMILGTIYETLAFLVSDGIFYTYGLFQYPTQSGILNGLYFAAIPGGDLGTLVDAAFIPVGLALIYAARPAFRRLGFAIPSRTQ